jgi:hypothetical protein
MSSIALHRWCAALLFCKGTISKIKWEKYVGLFLFARVLLLCRCEQLVQSR